MSIVINIGQSERIACYEVPDNELSVGSTLGSPRGTCIIEANVAIQSEYGTDHGANMFGTVILRHFDHVTGMSTPRDAVNYDPGGTSNGPNGLLGGVWRGVSFWFAIAAASFNQNFMVHALSASFRNFSIDPRRINTVSGQFSVWLHGETIVNQGMMLSPWDAPRYLWAEMEGVAGLDIDNCELRCDPRLSAIECNADVICLMAFRRNDCRIVFAGSTAQATIMASLRIQLSQTGKFYVKQYSSLLGYWKVDGIVDAHHLNVGYVIEIERQAFVALEIMPVS